MDSFNKNGKQLFFNKIIGLIYEIENDERFSNLTLKVGHENKRFASFCMKTDLFLELIKGYIVGEKVVVTYYLSSNKKNNRWYTTATLLTIERTI
jgi:hypothetical protein